MEELLKSAKDLFEGGYHVKALKIIEELSSSVKGEDETEMFDHLEGAILADLGEKSGNRALKFTYLLGSVASFSRIGSYPLYSANALFHLADQYDSVVYYKKALRHAQKARNFLESMMASENSNPILPDLVEDMASMDFIIKTAEAKIGGSVPEVSVGSPLNRCRIGQVQDNERLNSYWLGLDAGLKRNFMKVRIDDFKEHVKDKTGGVKALQKVLRYVEKNHNWIAWLCRTCGTKFSTRDQCKDHLEQEHVAGLKASSRKHRPQRISDVWADKIRFGGWEPVDAAAALEMINFHFADVKEFSYDQNGWSKDWCLAEDRERSDLLTQIRSLLVSLIEDNILSDSFRDMVIHSFIEELKISRDMLGDCHLLETPQSICFLACDELNRILVFLRKIECKKTDGTNLVSRAVDSFWQSSRFKEKIDVDSDFAFLLLDKRLLRGEVKHFDDEGVVRCFEPTVHYANVHPRGDDMLTWLNQNVSQEDDGFEFPRPVHTHNFDIWVAVMRSFQLTCETLETKYAKRLSLLEYDEALTEARELCENELQKLKPDHEKLKIYGSLLCKRCEKSDTKKSFLCAVQDIMKGVTIPTLYSPNLEHCMKFIRDQGIHLDDKTLFSSIKCLESNVKEKLAEID